MFDFFGDIGDFAAGSSESGGWFERLFGGMEGGGLFDAAGGAAEYMGGLFEAGEAAGAAGFFGRMAGMLEVGVDYYIDYKLLEGLGHTNHGNNYGNFRRAYHGMGEELKGSIANLRKVIKGHGFMLQQLRAHKNEKGVPEILQEYEKLGLNLPTEDLLRSAYRKVAQFFHPDKFPGDKIKEELFKELQEANTALNNREHCAEYLGTLAEKPDVIKDLFGKISDTNWENVFKNADRAKRLQLPGKVNEQNYTGARKWFEELSTTNKSALIFGGVVGVGLCVYMAAKYFENKKAKNSEALTEEPASWAVRSETNNRDTMRMAL
jgi:hypothetical protein